MAPQDVKITESDFVLAVSGGVDSMVLLDIVRRQVAPSKYVVVHFNHAIRTPAETDADAAVVGSYCQKHGIRLEVIELQLGATPSEATARQARYQALEAVRARHNYKSIVTAHHADDVLETAIINMLRGTGPKGLVALSSTPERYRPLLACRKADILAYANAHTVQWHEDSTNSNQQYMRNYVRQVILPRLTAAGADQKLLALIGQLRGVQNQLDEQLELFEQRLVEATAEGWQIRRLPFIQLDHVIASRLLHHLYLKYDFGKAPERRQIDKLVCFAKTAKNGRRADVSGATQLRIEPGRIMLVAKPKIPSRYAEPKIRIS